MEHYSISGVDCLERENNRGDDMNIPISKIGPLQMVDVLKAGRFQNGFARVCKVIESPNWHGDKSPLHLNKLFGHPWRYYDTHMVVQVAGCSLRCPFCYVDNLKKDYLCSEHDIVEWFLMFKEKYPEINVLHICGGLPARYPSFWGVLRDALDERGLQETIILSDTVFLENWFYDEHPWEHMDINNFALVGCLKGTTKENFIENTTINLFKSALGELHCYVKHKNFWLTLIKWDVTGLSKIFDLVPFEKIDFLTVVDYYATRMRR